MVTRRPASARLGVGIAGGAAVLALAGCNLGAAPVVYDLVELTGEQVNPYEMAAGDIDGDGDTDVVVGGSSRSAVLINDGSGGFGPEVEGFGEQRFTSLADVDGDGNLDTVGGFRLGGDAVPGYRLGDGNGGFAAPVTLEDLSSPPPNAALDVTPVDVDGDGDLDVVASAAVSGERHVAVYRNDGSGTFSTRTTHDLGFHTDSLNPVWLDTGDLDADGDADVVATTAQEVFDPDFGTRRRTMAAVALNDGTGAYATTAGGPIDVGGLGVLEVWPLRAALGDLDGDAAPDLVVGGPGSVGVHLGDGAGGFGAQVRHPVPGQKVDDVSTVDLDGDGHLDVVGSTGPGKAVAAYGDGAGGIELGHELVTGTDGLLDRDLLVADLDDDGDPDIAVDAQHDVVGVIENVDGRPEH